MSIPNQIRKLGNSKIQFEGQSSHLPSARLPISPQGAPKATLGTLKTMNHPLFSLVFSPFLPLSRSLNPTPHPVSSPKLRARPNKPELHFRFINHVRPRKNRNSSSGLFFTRSFQPSHTLPFALNRIQNQRPRAFPPTFSPLFPRAQRPQSKQKPHRHCKTPCAPKQSGTPLPLY
jgi:hypothetical protein